MLAKDSTKWFVGAVHLWQDHACEHALQIENIHLAAVHMYMFVSLVCSSQRCSKVLF